MEPTPRRSSPCLQAGLNQPLTIGVLAPGGRVKAWHEAALYTLTECGMATVIALAAPAPFDSGADHGGIRLAEQLESALFGVCNPSDRGCEITIGTPPDIDLLVQFGAPPATAKSTMTEWASRARLGVIEYRFQGVPDEEAVTAAILGGVATVTVSTLFHPCNNGRLVVLAEGIPAIANRWFIGRAKEDIQCKAAQLLLPSIRVVLGDRAPAVADAPAVALPMPNLQKADALAVGRYILRIAGTVTRNRVERLFYRQEYWFLAYRDIPDNGFALDVLTDGTGWTVLEAPPDRFYADPCVFHHDGVDHVFFEDYRYDTGKAVISWMEHRGGAFSPPRVVLECPWHLSYPFVFRFEGRIFLVPESEGTGRIELFEAVEYPLRWKRAAVLLDSLPAADTTLFEQDGAWWMFVSVGASIHGRGGANWDDLHLFFADTPFGPWHPHPQNPIKMDVRAARSAGRLFHADGRLLRPAQNCARTYGGSLVLCEVERLDRSVYRERVAAEIMPDQLPGSQGLHTLSFGKLLALVDGKLRRRWRW
jgi:hypothetical protein